MPKLLLVKHSNSNHNAHQPSHKWELTPEGIQRAKILATHLKPYAPKKLFASTMPRAIDTAKLAGGEIGDIPIIENPLLEEHSRKSNAPYGTVEDFRDRVRRMFEHPDDLIFGDETANQARERFSQGIAQIMGDVPQDEHIIVIAHGTVNSLFTAQHNKIDIYDLWSRLQLPSIIVLDLPTFTLETVIEDAGIP